MNEFLNESRSIKNNSGLVGRLINSNTQTKKQLKLKKFLVLKNHFLKIFTLNCMLHYTSYGTTAENQIKEAITNINIIT